MSKLKMTNVEKLKVLQLERNSVKEELGQLAIVKKEDLERFEMDLAEPKRIYLPFETMEYSDYLLEQFPNCNFIGSEGFLGITRDNKPVYDISTRINNLTRKNDEFETTSSYLNSNKRFFIWREFMRDYDHNYNYHIIFVFNKDVFNSSFEEEERRLSEIHSYYEHIIDDLIDIIICQDEAQQYETVYEEEMRKKMWDLEWFHEASKAYEKSIMNFQRPIYLV